MSMFDERRGHILDQGEIWVDKDETHHAIATMPGPYALRVYEFLKNRSGGLALDYTKYLTSISMPNGELAAESVENHIDAEMDAIRENPFLWLRGKPLLKALARRVEAYRRDVLGWEGRRVWIEPSDPDYPDPRAELGGYTLPEFKVVPRVLVRDLPQAQPGDERIVFLVTQGNYDSYRVLRPFVGNRTAAHRFAQELGRYEPTDIGDVEEFEDDSAGGGGVREYPKPWTSFTIRTIIEHRTGRITYNEVQTMVSTEPQPKDISIVNSESSRDTRLNPARVCVETTGPEKLYGRMRYAHRDRVVSTIKSVKED